MSKRNKHHRRCKSNGGDNSRNNLVWVNASKHAAWHKLFQNMTPHEIIEEINQKWLDPRYKLKLEKVNDRRSAS